MKQLNHYIIEKLKITKRKNVEYTLFPKSNMELKRMVDNEIKNNGSTCSLNHIDVSDITDFNNVFAYQRFNGDISGWDVSNAKTMTQMFLYSDYTGENGDISDWDVSSVVSMDAMFMNTNYTGDISQWDVSNVENMHYMFNTSKFNGDLSNWNISSVVNIAGMFKNSEFNNDSICKWDVSNIMNMSELFAYNKHFDQDISKWKVNKSCKLIGIYKDAAIHGTNRYYVHK